MAVHLHSGDTAFSSKLDKDDDDDDADEDDVHSVSGSDKNNNNMEDDFIAELTHRMAHFTLQEDDDTFDFSGIASPTQNFESAWDLSSPQSTLWSPEGSSSSTHSQEPSPPATPNDSTTYDMKNVEFRSHQTLIQEQIRAIEELSRLKQEHVLSPNVPYRKGKEEIQKKGNGNGNGRRSRPPRPAPLQTGTGMRALFLGGRCGTGVFLPRAATTCAPSSESTTNNNKQGKGCSVLIPARVVQALQLHFDKTAAMYAPKVVAFPPLRDLIVSGRDGIQNSQTTKAPADIQHEMILPREWTY